MCESGIGIGSIPLRESETDKNLPPPPKQPPGLISAIITEQGVKNPAAVYDMLLDIYT